MMSLLSPRILKLKIGRRDASDASVTEVSLLSPMMISRAFFSPATSPVYSAKLFVCLSPQNSLMEKRLPPCPSLIVTSAPAPESPGLPLDPPSKKIVISSCTLVFREDENGLSRREVSKIVAPLAPSVIRRARLLACRSTTSRESPREALGIAELAVVADERLFASRNFTASPRNVKLLKTAPRNPLTCAWQSAHVPNIPVRLPLATA
mmetsp:Transcript_15141/g.35013  ORF Transcript_15141/g.35013 Transcript_15141/m.35013 type:complete len:208 (-) Transcript_15141:244-867(-)